MNRQERRAVESRVKRAKRKGRMGRINTALETELVEIDGKSPLFQSEYDDTLRRPVKTDKVWTMRDVIASALNSPIEGEKKDGAKAAKRGALAMQIVNHTGPIDLESEEIADIKKCVGECGFNPIIVHQVYTMIEAKPKDEAETDASRSDEAG